jgi:ubiquinone/menaquinone biosynthesis C-methylase UbiE
MVGPDAMATDYLRIYDDHASTYDRLVSAEDHPGNLRRAIESLCPLAGAAVLEVGVGTGRVAAQLLAAGCGRLVGVDRAAAMIEVARGKLGDRAELIVADGRDLQAGEGWADLALAAWVFGHLRHWMPDDWKASVGGALAAMRRALRPGGTLLLVETLGTGRTEPAPPNAELAEYFAWLEGEQGMRRTAIRTDYRFASRAEARELVGFFFGEAALDRLPGRDEPDGTVLLPECTGLWSVTCGVSA